MNKDQLEVISAQQATRIELINSYHAQAVQSADDTKASSILCAFELTVLKKITPHGQFTALRERYCPKLSERACQFYIAGFRRVAAKSEHCSDLLEKADNPLVSPLGGEEKPKLLAEVTKVLDGGSFSDFARANGSLREKKPPQHHPVKLTPEQQLQADLNAAEALLHDACSAIALLRENHHQAIAKAKPDTRRKLMEHALWLTSTLPKFNKGRKPRK